MLSTAALLLNASVLAARARVPAVDNNRANNNANRWRVRA